MSTPVLIVGAGPSGLMLASELRRHGVEHRLIDRLMTPTTQSRATDLQPRSLEILASTGALPRVWERGFPIHAINVNSGDLQICRMRFADLETRFPHMLASAQSNTERALTEHYLGLGGVIERGVELCALVQDKSGVRATLRRPGQDEEPLHCQWLIGCDGARSRVRDLLALPFAGKTYPEHHMLADARVTWKIAKNELHGFLTNEGHLLVLALPGPDEYRLFIDVTPDETREPTRELFQEMLDRRVPFPGTIHEITWSSRFRQHCRQVPRYRVGRCFVVGDAAHVHSIIPGQGLNLGIQDAFNLGWKLALVSQGHASPGLLDSYHDERHPIGRLTLQMTHVFHRTLTLRRWLARWLRDRLMPRALAIKAAHDQTSNICAELSHHYRKSPIVGEERPPWLRRGPRLARDAPRPGERAPDLRLAGDSPQAPALDPEGTWLSDHLNGLDHLLLLFAGLAPLDDAARARLTGLVQAITSRVTAPLRIRQVLVTGVVTPTTIVDREGALHRRYGAARGGLFLIRPDGYIGFRGATLDAEPLLAHLARILRLPAE